MPRPTAAEALFPHLPRQSDVVAKQDHKATVAEAMYPRPQTKPLSYSQVKDLWRDRMLEIAGLRRKQ